MKEFISKDIQKAKPVELPLKNIFKGQEQNHQEVAREDEQVEEILRKEKLVEEDTSTDRGNHVEDEASFISDT